jgi:hypothetical protein
MSAIDQGSPSHDAAQHLDQPALEIGSSDVIVSLLSFAVSLALLALAMLLAMSPLASFQACIALYVANLFVPLAFLAVRWRRKAELTLPVLLLITTFACGPLGGLGCGFVARALHHRGASPHRLRYWYEYIAGVVSRERIGYIYEELSSGRLHSDPASEVPRFRPILHGASTEEQQRVLAVIGRRYHADFRPALRDGLRNKDGFIRAQAAAVASRLDVEEKKRIWAPAQTRVAEPENS